MAKIRKIYDEAIKPDGSKQVIYPITSTRAVYTPTNITVDTLLNEGYRFGGVVLPTDSPTFTDQRVFYGASVPGVYPNFGGISVDGGEAIFLMYNGTEWKKGIFGGAGSNNLTGFKSLASISELPLEETTIGYLIEDSTLPEGFSKQVLYVWVGENGDTLDGLYQNCGQLRGASAYESAVRNGYEGTVEEWLNDPVNGIKGNGIKSWTVDQSTADSGESTITVEFDKTPTETFKVKNGKGISSITETPSVANGGTNVIHINLSDGTSYDIDVKNGSASDGFYATATLLNTAIPSPNVGDYAFVSKAGDGTFPAYIYVCTTAGTWTNSEQEFTTEVAQVSVSQNTETGHTDINIGSDSYPVASVEEVSQLGQYVDNPEWVRVITDTNDRILYGVKTDGKFYFGGGCPPQVQEYVQNIIDGLSLDEYEDIVAFLSDYLGSDTTLKVLIDGINASKLDKGGLDPNALNSVQAVENPEFIQVTTDSENKILEGITSEGVKQVNIPINTPSANIEHVENPEWIEVKTDKDDKIIGGIREDGSYRNEIGVSTSVVNCDEINSNNINTGKQGALSLINAENKYIGTSIKALYPKETIGTILRNLKFGKHQIAKNQYPDWTGSTINHPVYTPLSLLWFSDIHDNLENLARIKEFYDMYSDYINDSLFTGDAVHTPFNAARVQAYWGSISQNPILFTVGNHDICTTLSPFNPVSPKAGYDIYLKPYLSYTNINEVENQLYWYKDYPAACSPECPSGVRLISLDQYHWKEQTYIGAWVPSVYEDGMSVDTGQQEAWLINLLNDSKENGFAVIIAIHGPNTSCTGMQCSFDTPDAEMVANAEYAQIHDDMFDCVKNFIDAGGEFICWLTGHMHQDWVKYANDYPNQIVLSVATAAYDMYDRPDEMVKDTKSMDRINFLTIDTWMKYIRLYRIGIDYDRHGRHVGSLVLDYKNKNIISNF